MRLARTVALSIALIAACRSRDDAGRGEPPTTGTTAPPVAPVPDAAATAVDAALSAERAVEELWQRYRELHAHATPANAIATGKVLWALLTPEAQALVDQAGKATIAAAGSVRIELGELRFKLLGESAATRVAFMKEATITELVHNPDRRTGTSTISTVELTARGANQTLTFALVRIDDGPWRFGPSPQLIAADAEVFRLPPGEEHTVGAPSVEALIAAWKHANASGTGWDAYNLLSPALRRKILRMVASVGGSGAADAARIFEKTLTDRRARGMAITAMTIVDRADERATVEIRYSDGTSEQATAVSVDGAWWFEMPL